MDKRFCFYWTCTVSNTLVNLRLDIEIIMGDSKIQIANVESGCGHLLEVAVYMRFHIY